MIAGPMGAKRRSGSERSDGPDHAPDRRSRSESEALEVQVVKALQVTEDLQRVSRLCVPHRACKSREDSSPTILVRATNGERADDAVERLRVDFRAPSEREVVFYINPSVTAPRLGVMCALPSCAMPSRTASDAGRPGVSVQVLAPPEGGSFRREGPFSISLGEWCRMRSQIASATVGSPR